MSTVLQRGEHVLPHQAQCIRRDIDGEDIACNLGAKALGYMLTAEQVEDRRIGKHPDLPYQYIITAPSHSALSWTAFYTLDALQAWARAYDLRVVPRVPEPGQYFSVFLPENTNGFQPLSEA